MKTHRRLLSQIDRRAAERLTGDCFFASPGFADLWRAKGGRAVAWIAEDAGRPAAMLPGVEFGRGPLCRFQAMPDGCYGGIFFDEDSNLDRERIARLLLDAVVRHGYMKTFLFDFYGTFPPDSRFESVLCATTLVDISDPRWLPPDKKLVSQIRKAEREGVQVEPFRWEKHKRDFLTLVRITETRHGGKPLYNAAFFKALADLAEEDGRIRWLWCEYDGRPVCSHIYFIENGVLQGWQKYLDKSFSFLKADQYVRLTMCQEIAQEGVGLLNLGATPRGAIGLAHYKRRWGGEPAYYNCLVLKRGLGRFVRERRPLSPVICADAPLLRQGGASAHLSIQREAASPARDAGRLDKVRHLPDAKKGAQPRGPLQRRQ
jgi:hypothetical protein